MAAAYAATFRRALIMGPRLHGAKQRVGYQIRTPAYSRTFSDLIKPDISKRLIVVDTLALVRKLESNGLPTKQAEAITEAFKDVQTDSYDNVSHNFATKVEMEKSVMTLEANSSKFESEVKSSVNHYVSLLQQENEKVKSDLEKIRSELRYEVDKVTAGLRLDLNLEKGRIRDELNHQHQETINLSSKVEKEAHGLRALIEAFKYESIKYCVGLIISFLAAGLALLRFFH